MGFQFRSKFAQPCSKGDPIDWRDRHRCTRRPRQHGNDLISFILKLSNLCPCLDCLRYLALSSTGTLVVLQALLHLIDTGLDFWEALRREPQELAELIDVKILV